MNDGRIFEAWRLATEGDIPAALDRLGSRDEAESGPPSLPRAMAGALRVQAGQVELGLEILASDWTLASADAAGLAGAILFSQARFEEALPALRHAVAGPSQDPGAHLVNLGRALVYLGRAAEGLPALQGGVALSTHDQAVAAQSLAEALLALGRFDEALAALPETAEDEALVAARASVLAMAGRHDEAARYLSQASERAPDSLPLLLLQADLADARGRTGEAVRLLKQALDQAPDHLAIWVRLARCGRAGEASPYAREAADQALLLARDKTPADRALALAAHAHVLAAAGATGEAEATYRQALELAPGQVPALSGLGQLLLQTGRVEDAIACFERVKAAAPLQGWSQLIHARQVPEGRETLDNLERFARQPSLEGPVRSGLLLTLAEAWDKKKDFDRAMTLAREGNEASKPRLTYDPAAHRQRVEREMARFSRAFMDSRAGWGHPTRLPVFVLGMPRSGTTLTEQILASHSQVFGAGELGQIPEQIGKLEAWQAKLGSGLHYPECVADLTADMSRIHAGMLLEKLQAFDPAARHVVDKLPHNFEHIGLIKLLFPNAIIFHCQREPRDIAVSNYITDYAAKFGGMGFAYDLGWIGEQLVDHHRLMRHWHEVFPGQIFEVVYEELVEDTEAWARRMIDFMGLDWEPGVLQFQDLERSVKTASVWQVRQPVYQTSKARWKRYEAHLAPLEAALLEVPPLPDPLPLPEVPPGLFGTGMAHLRANQPAEAEATFSRLIAACPNHAGAHHFLGAAQLQRGRPAEAVLSMRRAIKILPFHPSWWENLARAEHAAGNEEAAKAALEKASRLRRPPNETPADSPAAAAPVEEEPRVLAPG